MNKGIVVYKSKYGAAKQYAEWLAQELDYDIAKMSKDIMRCVENYENIILCGGIYASGISGLDLFGKNADKIKGGKTAVFCVGASPFEEKAFEEIKAHNMKGALKDIPLFYGRGAWDEEKMSFKDRTLCKILQKSLSKKDPSSYEPWMAALMSAAGQKCDWTDKAYLSPLI